jgi:hypothetical protein
MAMEDMTLIGYLNLVEKLIVNLNKRDKTGMLSVLEETNLLDELYYE